MTITYGSVCSGIEAASVAWHPLGWKAAWLAEIEPFPAKLLHHHYGSGQPHHMPSPDDDGLSQEDAKERRAAILRVRTLPLTPLTGDVPPNLGDMTKIADMVRSQSVVAPDVLVGGTPCQAFSIAGLRNSLSDTRGQLSLSFVDLANAIDSVRLVRGEPESIVLWENVPGVLNTKDNAFGCFLAALAGEDEPLQPSGGKWTNAGCVLGPQRTVAWRVLDAQYFGVAQRRRRVFVIASARKGFDPTKVLFEFDGLRRDIAPSRGTGQEVAGSTATRTSGGSGLGTDFECAGGLQPVVGTITTNVMKCDQAGSAGNMLIHATWPAEIASTLNASFGSKLGLENQHINSGAPLFVPAFGIPGNWIGRKPENGGNAIEPMHDVSPCLTSTDRHGVAHTLIGAFKGGQGSKAGGIGFDENVSPTLSAADSGSNRAPVIAFDSRQDPISSTEVFGALGSSSPQAQAVANGIMYSYYSHDYAHDRITDVSGVNTAITAEAHASGNLNIFNCMAVRRLTPRECERLQAFPEIQRTYIIEVHQPNTSNVCYPDQQSTNVLAEPNYHKSRNSASPVEENGSQSHAQFVPVNLNAHQDASSAPVLVHVHIDLDRQHVQLSCQGRSLLSVNTADKSVWCRLPIQADDFVQLSVAIVTWLEKTTPSGEAALQMNASGFFPLEIGKWLVSLSGQETNELVNDVEKFTLSLSECMKFITSEAGQSFQNSDLKYQTLFSCVSAAISSFIQDKTRLVNSYAISVEVSSGYTFLPLEAKPTSDGPRYKALGNSMCVYNMRWLGKRINDAIIGSPK